MGGMPSPVIRANSLALTPWGETAESVPKPIFTPEPDRRAEHGRAGRQRGPGLGGDLGRELVGPAAGPLAGQQRRHQVRPLLLHEREGLLAQERAVLDRVDPGQDRVAGGPVAVAVGGDLLPQPVGLVDQGRHLLGRQLRRVDLVGQREHAAGGAELDDVGPVLDLDTAPPRGSRPGPWAIPSAGPSLAEQVVADPVAVGVAAAGAQGVHGDEHPRAGDQPAGDAVAQADVEEVAPSRRRGPW